MNKIKLLAAAAVIASFALAPATADARHVKSHVDTTMQNEYGYQKDMKGNKHVITVSEISLKEKQNKSLMPDPAAGGLTEADLANVTEYLLKGNFN